MTATHPAPIHPALAAGEVAVITGAASGIGLAAARRYAALGLKLVLADLAGPALERAAAEVAAQAPGGAADVRAVATDVAQEAQVRRLADAAFDAFGSVAVLMNNAAIGDNPGASWENPEGWQRLLAINLHGVIHGVQAFLPRMLAGGRPGLVINTGSKQGITLPPGNSAYNLAKAGVKAFTESLAHELRNVPGGRISAHLLIPGFTFTGMTGAAEKPAAAWSAEQVVDFLLQGLARGDFYVLCPDNDVARPLDERRMQWMADDVIKNRPALSRWHPDYKDAFAAFVKG